ncbi:MAG: DNA primase [Pseudarcicella sp.]|nr:DNA primase [Pseudarcicella sp.]MBP6410557.1 DNA primase [Pseudarcicella sp.]
MRIDQQTIEQIKQTAEISEVIGDYVSLKKKGANLWACCPFHGEKSPSFSVSPAKGIYKCFGCGKSGDSVRFIMDIEGLGYLESLKHLAKKYSIEIQESKITDQQLFEQNQRESLFIVLNFANNYYQNLLKNNDEGKAIGYSYFKERGFSDLTIKTFELGYSLDNWDAFTKNGIENGYNIDILEKAGLTILKDDNKRFDRFRNRVIFPIHNISGKVIAFGARILKADKNSPKYLNSPETEVYHKSNSLYGVFQAKNKIRSEDNCYLVEGYTDVISLHQAGIHNVVASSGTSLTDEQIKLIKRFTKNITVLYDGDPAGIKASLRGMEMILKEDMNVKLVTFPAGEDPDSYVKKVGLEDFLKHLKDNATDFITFKTKLSLDESDGNPLIKAKLVNEIVESISFIPDPIKKSIFIKQTSEKFGIDEQTLNNELKKIVLEKSIQAEKSKNKIIPKTQLSKDLPEGVSLSGQTNNNVEEKSSSENNHDDDFLAFIQAQENENTEEKKSVNDLELQEKECVRLLINYSTKEVDPEVAPGVTLVQYVLNEIDGIEFKTPIFKTIIGIFRDNFALGVEPSHSLFISHELTEIQSKATELLFDRYEISDGWLKNEIIVPTEADKLMDMAFTNVLRLKRAINNEQIKEVKSKIKNASNSEISDLLMQEYMEYKETDKILAKELGRVVNK